ncbi:hypothetical protein M3Y97_00608600 [Aphelenchoides bicaudatus]|nr:hypothetical protein M3Y97_00608600 [Aphelenchoides bicaudatus]
MKIILICLFSILLLSDIAFGVKPYSNRRPHKCPSGTKDWHKKCTVGMGYNDCVPYGGPEAPVDCYSGKGQYAFEPVNGICCDFGDNFDYNKVIDSRGIWTI